MCVYVGWRGVVSVSDCHMIRHRDGVCVCVCGGGGSISDCHMIRHRDGVCVCVGGGVLSPTVT